MVCLLVDMFTADIRLTGRAILAGRGRVEAAKLLGLSEVPCLRLDYMSEMERRAYVLAYNKTGLECRMGRRFVGGIAWGADVGGSGL